ncbi:MAG: DUF3293 domain-containing protein [Bacteroidota bacterium]
MDDNSSNIDQALLQAYLSTDYRLLNTSIVIKIGTINPDLDSFIIDNNAYSWVFISAENPRSIRLKPEENQQNHLKLLKMAQKRGYEYWEGIGEGKDGKWPAEQSLLILDLSTNEILELAKHFTQNAVVVGQLNQKSRLLWTNT